MAILTLSTIPDIYPVYTDNLILNVKDSTAGNNYYYKADVYINDVLEDSFSYPANPLTPFDADINLSTIISPYIESSVYIPTGGTVFELIPNSITKYKVNVFVYSGTTDTGVSGTTGDKYTFNGCASSTDFFVMDTFMFDGYNGPRFLSWWNTDREIVRNSPYCFNHAFLTTIVGDYTSTKSYFSGITLTRHQFDGSTSAITFNYVNDGTTKSLLCIDVSPWTLFMLGYYTFIDENTDYYEVEAIPYLISPVKINIYYNPKITDNAGYSFAYVNRLGGLDFFGSLGSNNKTYEIDREILEQFTIQKPYNTSADREFTIQTQFLTSYQAAKLKDLFISPSIKLSIFGNRDDSEYYYTTDVIITNKEYVIRERYPKTDFIQYNITIKPLNKFHIQKY